jgi:ribosomal protein S18 acetylase RimI-like enzyme
MSKREEQTNIKIATEESDVDRVNEFFNSYEIKNELNWFTYRDTLARAMSRDDRDIFYVEKDDGISGAVMVWGESRVLEKKEAQIRLVAVDPEDRGSGVGKKLCEKAEEFAKRGDNSRVTADVDSSSDSVEFWKACGYSPTEIWSTDNGREMYRMTKHLD